MARSRSDGMDAEAFDLLKRLLERHAVEMASGQPNKHLTCTWCFERAAHDLATGTHHCDCVCHEAARLLQQVGMLAAA